MQPCIKLLGADFELANSIETDDRRDGRVADAARRLLDEIPGYPQQRGWYGTTIEWGRRYLASNGGSAYIDSDHLEINLPEHTRAADHAALLHAGLRIARTAQLAAAARLPAGRLNVMAAVSDGRESWGHHLNVMVRRQLFDELFTRKPHLASFLATHLVTAAVYAGQGMVGPGNRRAACAYQMSQRADWFEEFVGHQTTHRRPLLNLRDESHAGPEWARMHLIYFDNVLCPVANYLKAGTTQLVLAMMEAGWTDPGLLLDDPLAAASEVSRDLSLTRALPLVQRGRKATAVEVQQGLADLAGEFLAAGLVEEAVPGARAIVDCWQTTLAMLKQRDLAALARRCDWVLKYLLLERQRGRKGLSWQSPEVKCLDLLYASLDPEEGLFWQMNAAGLVEGMPDPERIERFVQEPPDDSRAYLRAHVLRRFGEHIADLDWDRIRFRLDSGRLWWAETVLAMPDPHRLGRDESAPILERCASLQALIEAVGGEARSTSSGGGWGWWSSRRQQRTSDVWGERSGCASEPPRLPAPGSWE
jgi:proteasome accessory factor A